MTKCTYNVAYLKRGHVFHTNQQQNDIFFNSGITFPETYKCIDNTVLH